MYYKENRNVSKKEYNIQIYNVFERKIIYHKEEKYI